MKNGETQSGSGKTQSSNGKTQSGNGKTQNGNGNGHINTVEQNGGNMPKDEQKSTSMSISQSLEGYNSLTNLNLSFMDSVLDISDSTLNTYVTNIVEYLDKELDEANPLKCGGNTTMPSDDKIIYGVNFGHGQVDSNSDDVSVVLKKSTSLICDAFIGNTKQ